MLQEALALPELQSPSSLPPDLILGWGRPPVLEGKVPGMCIGECQMNLRGYGQVQGVNIHVEDAVESLDNSRATNRRIPDAPEGKGLYEIWEYC